MSGGNVAIPATAFLNKTSQIYNDQLLVSFLSEHELSKYPCMHLILNCGVNIQLTIPNVVIYSQL